MDTVSQAYSSMNGKALSNPALMVDHVFDLLQQYRPEGDSGEYALEVLRGLIRDVMPIALRERKADPGEWILGKHGAPGREALARWHNMRARWQYAYTSAPGTWYDLSYVYCAIEPNSMIRHAVRMAAADSTVQVTVRR